MSSNDNELAVGASRPIAALRSRLVELAVNCERLAAWYRTDVVPDPGGEAENQDDFAQFYREVAAVLASSPPPPSETKEEDPKVARSVRQK